MELTELPLELFQIIMTDVVLHLGISKSVRLRLVSRIFDSQVQCVIYALPAFDSLGRHRLPLELQAPLKMHPMMTTRLILSKMNSVSHERPLCFAITRAVAYLETKYEQKDPDVQLEFTKALAEAAARAIKLSDVVNALIMNSKAVLKVLNKWRDNHQFYSFFTNETGEMPRHPVEQITPTSSAYIDTTSQDALVAALCAGHIELATRLLQSGVNATTKSPAFGVPLQVAARLGAQDFVQTALDGFSGQGNSADADMPGCIEDARLFVVQGAATGGHEQLIRMIFDKQEENQESTLCGKLDQPIVSATTNGHEHIALLLLEYRTPITSNEATEDQKLDLTRREVRFWRNLSRNGARNGCARIERIAFETAARLRSENNMAVGAEDICAD